MHVWDTLWQGGVTGLLVDSNGDGLTDGSMACLVPITVDRFTPELWAAAANLAARLGLETPALHLPVACMTDTVASWQLPVLLAVSATGPDRSATQWHAATVDTTLLADGGVQVCWLRRGEQRVLWLQAATAQDLAQLLNQLAAATSEPPVHVHGRPDPETDLDLADLYTSSEGGVFTAHHDGFTPDDIRLRLVLGPATDCQAGLAAIDLAARLGLESAGLTLPLVIASETVPTNIARGEQLFLLGFPHPPMRGFTTLAPAARVIWQRAIRI